jgi:hypothetical protein
LVVIAALITSGAEGELAMTTQETTTATKPETTAPKSYSIRLTAGVEEVLITAYQTKAGWTSAATRYREKAVKGKKRQGERGASAQHANADAAKAAIEKLAAAFVKNGWTRPERKALGGFVRKPDAFTISNIPKPSAKK